MTPEGISRRVAAKDEESLSLTGKRELRSSVLTLVDDVLAHGWGRVEVRVSKHKIRAVEITKTIEA